MRLKIRAVWLEAGDINSRFFHWFANHRRISNSIWELKNQDGIMLGEQSAIKEELARHFQGIYNQVQSLNLPQLLKAISLCNTLYKLITKIITDRMREVLGRCISEEQIGLLPNIQITDVVGIAQECLHTIKQRRLRTFVLKVDLVISFDTVDWSMLRFILT